MLLLMKQSKKVNTPGTLDADETKRLGRDVYWIEVLVNNQKKWNKETKEKLYIVNIPTMRDFQTFRLTCNNPNYSTIYKRIKVGKLYKFSYFSNLEILNVECTPVYTIKNKIMDLIVSKYKKPNSSESMTQLILENPTTLYDKDIRLLVDMKKYQHLEMNAEYNIKFKWWGIDYLVTDIQPISDNNPQQ